MIDPYSSITAVIWLPLVIYALANLKDKNTKLKSIIAFSLALVIGLAPIVLQFFIEGANFTSLLMVFALANLVGAGIFYNTKKIDISIAYNILRVIWAFIIFYYIIDLAITHSFMPNVDSGVVVSKSTLYNSLILTSIYTAVFALVNTIVSMAILSKNRLLFLSLFESGYRTTIIVSFAALIINVIFSVIFLIEPNTITISIVFFVSLLLALSFAGYRRNERISLYSMLDFCLLALSSTTLALISGEVILLIISSAILGISYSEYLRIRRYFPLNYLNDLSKISFITLLTKIKRRFHVTRRAYRANSKIQLFYSKKQASKTSYIQTIDSDSKTEVTSSIGGTTPKNFSEDKIITPDAFGERLLRTKKLVLILGSGSILHKRIPVIKKLLASIPKVEIEIIIHPIIGKYVNQLYLELGEIHSNNVTLTLLDDFQEENLENADLIVTIGAKDITNPVLFKSSSINFCFISQYTSKLIVMLDNFDPGFSGKINPLFKMADVKLMQGEVNVLLAETMTKVKNAK